MIYTMVRTLTANPVIDPPILFVTGGRDCLVAVNCILADAEEAELDSYPILSATPRRSACYLFDLWAYFLHDQLSSSATFISFKPCFFIAGFSVPWFSGVRSNRLSPQASLSTIDTAEQYF